MWISDDTTWNLTAQRRKLSSDVMPLSSPGKSQRYGGEINEIIAGLTVSGLGMRQTGHRGILPLTSNIY